MIYLVRCGPFYKIGYTRSCKAESRIKGLQTGNPYPIELVATWPGSQNDEIRLHHKFFERWERGEWFALSDDDLAELLSGYAEV